MKKNTISTITIGITPLAAVIVFLLASLSLAGCENSPQNSGVINIAAIKGVTAPAAGEIPVTAITETAQYTGTVTWEITDGGDFTGNFDASTSYTATITLTVKEGYTLQGVKEDFFTVAGAKASNSANSGVITAIFSPTPKTINIREIGVTAPVTNATPATTITETDQYTGRVTWNITNGAELTGKFVVSTSYTAIITLTPKTGYTLQGVEADFFTVAGADLVYSYANSGDITAIFPRTIGTASNPSKVDIMNIALNKQPATGADPYMVEVIETLQYSGYITSWSPDDGPFKPNGSYKATITLTAKTGCTFRGVTKDYFRVTGAIKTTNPAIPAVDPSDDDDIDPYNIDIIAEFYVSVSKIDTDDPIEGLTAPETDATPAPATAITETEQYKGTVAWYEKGKSTAFAGPFGPDIEYTAKITLWANTGYTFKDVPANSFTVDGAIVGETAKSVSHPAGTGSTLVITVVYNNTEAKQIEHLEIEGVVFPKVGEKPQAIDKNINTRNQEYTAEISWPIPSTSVFAAGEIYGATIYVTPRAGYTLTGVGDFYVEGATCSNDADSGIVSVVFPATAANPDRFIDVSGDPPATDGYINHINFSIIGAELTVTWSPNPSDGIFKKNQIYKAILTISPESEDFTLYGIDKYYFVVSNVTGTSTSYASVNKNTGKITIEFPKTGPE